MTQNTPLLQGVGPGSYSLNGRVVENSSEHFKEHL